MIIAKHGLLAAARLRKVVPGVQRVIVARTDGIAMYDDVPLEARDGGAALTAAVVGLAATSTRAFGLGAAGVASVRGERGTLVVAPVDGGHLLAILIEGVEDASVAEASGAVRDEAERLRALSGLAVAAR